MGLRKAGQTTRLELSDGDYLEVKKKLSQRDRETLLNEMPETAEGVSLTPQQGLQVVHVLFDLLVTGWSLDEPVSLDAYLDLEDDSADEVNNKIVEYFGSLMPVTPDEKQSKSRKT